MLLKLSRSGKFYIITQIALPGFVLSYHDDVTSWLYELKMSAEYREQIGFKSALDRVHQVFVEVSKCKTAKEAE